MLRKSGICEILLSLRLGKGSLPFAPANYHCIATATATGGDDVHASFKSSASSPTRLLPPSAGWVRASVTEFPRLLPFTHPISAYRKRDVERLHPVLDYGVRRVSTGLSGKAYVIGCDCFEHNTPFPCASCKAFPCTLAILNTSLRIVYTASVHNICVALQCPWTLLGIGGLWMSPRFRCPFSLS